MSVQLEVYMIQAGKMCDKDQLFGADPQTAIFSRPGRDLELKRGNLPYDDDVPKYDTIWWRGPNPGSAPGGTAVFEDVEDLTIKFSVNYTHGMQCPGTTGRFDLTPGVRRMLQVVHVVQLDALQKGIYFNVFYHVIANEVRETSAKQ